MLNLQPVNPFLKLKARSLFLWMFVILITVYCAVNLFFLFAVPLIFGFIGLNIKEQIVNVICYCLIYGLLCLWVLQRYSQLQINPKDMMGKLPPRDQWIPIAGIIAPLLLFIIGADLLSSYFLSLLPPGLFKFFLNNNFLHYSLYVSNSYFSIYYYLLFSFYLFVLNPITEEFIYRGFLLHRWGTKWGIKPAILVCSVCSVVFGFNDLQDFVSYSVFSIVMSLFYLQNRTLMVPIVAHALNNAVSFSLLLVFSPKNELAATTFFSNWRLGLLCIALSAPFIIRFIYKKWPDQGVSLPYWFNRNSKNLGQQGFN